MPQGPDSSSKLPSAPAPPPAPAPAAPKPVMPPERKRAFLTSPNVRASILTVAFEKGILQQDHGDIVNETLMMALKARLPAAEDESMRIVNRIAAVSCFKKRKQDLPPDLARLEAELAEGGRGEDGEIIAADSPELENRVEIQQILREGEARFARFGVYLEAKAKNESAEEVARRIGVTGGYLRNEWKRIETFLAKKAKGVGLLVVLGALFFGWRGWRAHEEATGWATYASHRVPPAALDARALRQRGTKAWDAGAWQACADDFDAAARLDPRGETPEQADQRHECEDNAKRKDVLNPTEYNSKVPLH